MIAPMNIPLLNWLLFIHHTTPQICSSLQQSGPYRNIRIGELNEWKKKKKKKKIFYFFLVPFNEMDLAALERDYNW